VDIELQAPSASASAARAELVMRRVVMFDSRGH
jgi:hypothetical protein